MSRLSRMGLPLSRVSSTARRRECFCTCRASAYKYFARWWPESFCQPCNAAPAAFTAASTSATLPCATSASFSPVAGSLVSKYFPSSGARHLPAIKCPNRRLLASSHSKDSLASSGAGPYSIVPNFSITLIRLVSLTQLDGDVPPSSDQLREIPIGAQYQRACRCWRQGEKDAVPATRHRALPSSTPAIPGTAWRYESHLPV